MRRPDRCRWLKDKEIGRWFMPGCMGGAVYGESGCTCREGDVGLKADHDGPTLDERVASLEAIVAGLVATQPPQPGAPEG